MAPLIARQYRQRKHTLTPELTRNLVWRYSALGGLPPRTTPFVFSEPVGAHADAQGFGRIAALFRHRGKATVSLHLHDWLAELANAIPGESPISIFELCAAIPMVCIALDWPQQKHRTCVLCRDNKAAVSAPVKGSSTSTLGALLTTLFWTLAARGATTWWIEYVRTKSNYADTPSRDCNAQCGYGCTRLTGHAPSAFRESFKSRDAIHREPTLVHDGGKIGEQSFCDLWNPGLSCDGDT